MKSISKTTILLILITTAAFLIRLIRIVNFPPLLWDEAALGYNSYSILRTLRDEYGQILPLIFKSFGDYKPGFYIYLAAPFIALFDLNELSVRLPSVIFGSLTPLFLYLLITQISPKSRKLGLIAALITTFNPINIHYSRGAWETNILTFQLVIASYLFFKYINTTKTKFLFFSSICFAISLYTYQSAKLITPLLILFLVVLNFRFLVPRIKHTLIAFALPVIFLSLPLIYGLIFQSSASRIQVVNLFSYPRTTEELSVVKNESSPLSYKLFNNENVYFLRIFLNHYFNYFSPKFLVFQGDWQNTRHADPYHGIILYPSLVFFLLGLIKLATSHPIKKLEKFFLFWLLAAPIPAALTRDLVQATRALSLSIPLIYFIASGISFTHNLIKSKILFTAIIGIYILSFVYYSELYHFHLGRKIPSEWLFGYKQAMEYTIQNQHKFDNIYISDFYGQPYIYYLFYSKYSPSQYQKYAFLKQDTLDTGKIENISNVHFGSFDFKGQKNQPKSLLILTHEELVRQGVNPDEHQLIHLSPINGYSTFYAYETN